MGQVAGLAVDSQDHVWVLQRPRTSTVDELGADQKPPRSECCAQTPAVLEFDSAGHVLKAWGGPGFVSDWPHTEHAIWVDGQGDVWIGGSGTGDRQVLKFSASGQLLLEIGHPSDAPADNRDTSILGQPAGIQVDDAAHEVYIADGYLNNRVVVYDSVSGQFHRGWGAYGIALDQIQSAAPERPAGTAPSHDADYVPGGTPDPQFRTPVHCARLSADGFVYVCDRRNDRIQVFTREGHFEKEFLVHPTTLGNGSVWTIELSHDRGQHYLLVADGEDNVIWVLDRSDGHTVSSFGHNGRNAGQFHWVHQTAMDSKGNLYTGEVDTGKRVQKFVLERRAHH
jgi:DNA-binding beta-propeller fold protein YncE